MKPSYAFYDNTNCYIRAAITLIIGIVMVAWPEAVKKYINEHGGSSQWATWETPIETAGNWPVYGTVYAEWKDWEVNDTNNNQ